MGILFYFVITSFSHFLVLFFLVSFLYLLNCLHLNPLFSLVPSWFSPPCPWGRVSEWLGGPWCLWVKPRHWVSTAPTAELRGSEGCGWHRSTRGQESIWSIILKMENDWSYKQQDCKSKCTLLMKCQISTAYTALACLPVCVHDNRLIVLWTITLL